VNHSDRLQKIEIYGRAYDILVDALAQLPKEMWGFKPSPGEWSIHEVIIHIADSEANSYARCRRAIAEPGSTVMAYDEVRWAATLRYAEQDTAEALELFKRLRHNTYRLIQTLPDSVWAHTIEHPENGRMTLDDWLDVYARHIPEHVDQMRRTYAAWSKYKQV